MSHSNAGHGFLCVCCREDHPEHEATIDDQFGGPVCEDCRLRVIKAVAWLRGADIRRPLVKGDINNYNCKRLNNI